MPISEKLRMGKILTFISMTLIVLGAGTLSLYWLSNKPRAQRTPPKVLPPLVEVTEVTPKSYRVLIHALGTVKAAQSVDLSAQVSGEVIEVNERLRPGERFRKGELIARIDPVDFELALRQKQAELIQAQSDLALERGQQAIARREYELFGEDINGTDLALLLRVPYYNAARAKVEAAEASVEKAQLDLNRTRIVAPFDALIQSRSVSLGSQLSIGSKVATLIDTQRFWIEATLTPGQLPWIRHDVNASEVSITPRNGKQRFPLGTVKTVLADVAAEGRMARIIIEVPKPYDAGVGTPLLLNDIVSVTIKGKLMENVVAIPRADVHEGNRIWCLAPDGTLTIKSVYPVWDTRDVLYIHAGVIGDNERLITTNLAAPVAGMRLRTPGAKNAEPR